MEGDKRFRELIDRSFVEEVSEGERQLIHDHIRDCDGCKRYLELTARTIRGLREFTFTSEPDSNAQVREILAHHTETMRQHNVQFKVWAAFAVALSMSIVGSALVYQVAKLLTVRMHFHTAQVQAGVLVFWLLPSFCAALRLLAAPGENRGYGMTQQSAVLLIAFLAGLVVAAVLLGTARRNVLPRSAMVIAALAIPIWVVYFASSQGRSLLASKGFLSSMPEALWFGLTFGVFTAAFFLALGYIYGDAKRRQMPAWAWVIAAFLIPNLIGFILYFVFRGPLLGPCSSCGKPIRGGEAFCSHCGCSQGSSIGRITAHNRTI